MWNSTLRDPADPTTLSAGLHPGNSEGHLIEAFPASAKERFKKWMFDVAAFIGFVCETLLYGVNIVLFSVAMLYLIWWRKTRALNTPMLMATCVLFALCTTHFTLEFDNMLHVLILHPGEMPISTETHLLIGADILFSITDFVGNTVLIYRCWLIWGRALWAAALPLLIALASVTCAMAGLAILATTAPTAVFAPPDIIKFGTASFSMSLILNFLITTLIIVRLYRLSRYARYPTDLLSQNTKNTSQTAMGCPRTTRMGRSEGMGKTQRQARAAMGVILESGMLFFVAQLIFVVVYALGHPAQAIVVPAALQIYCISPLLIIVRIGMGLVSEETNTTIDNETITTMHFAPRPIEDHSEDRMSDMEPSLPERKVPKESGGSEV